MKNQRGVLSTATLASVIAVGLGIFSVGLSARAINKAENGGGGGGDSATSSVTLSEYSISPDDIVVASQGTLRVENTGEIIHNLAVEGEQVTTKDIEGGGADTLDVSTLKEGEYNVYCSIPGHKSQGMEAKMKVSADVNNESKGVPAQMDPEHMDEMMKERTDTFLELATKKGNIEKTTFLEPKVLEDGTKQFNLTASVFDWEVEPGKTVKAWGYNKQVPGPNIKVAIGDKVKVVLKNELDESTSIHWHGVNGIPNAVDGVPDVTQEPIKPGDTYSYDFTAGILSVGMYHSHHNAQVQVPNGLLGAFLVGDVPLPNGVNVSQEIPMVLNDAGNIGFSLNGKSFPGTKAIATKKGEWIKIHYMNEGLTSHPMHTHGFQQMVIARDGTALPDPYFADTLNVAPGERYTVLVNTNIEGAWAWHCHILTHAEGPEGMFGMVTAIVVS